MLSRSLRKSFRNVAASSLMKQYRACLSFVTSAFRCTVAGFLVRSISFTLRVRNSYEELDSLAQDVIILRRRARETAQRMRRVLDEITEDEGRVAGIIEGLGLSQDERQIAYLIFAEDEPENARRTLKEHYGCADPEAAIRAVSAKIKVAKT